MIEKVTPGLYKVKEKEDRRGRPINVYVAKGETLNESRRRGFHRILDMTKTMWYVVEDAEILADDRHGSNVVHISNLKSRHKTKSRAIESLK